MRKMSIQFTNVRFVISNMLSIATTSKKSNFVCKQNHKKIMVGRRVKVSQAKLALIGSSLVSFSEPSEFQSVCCKYCQKQDWWFHEHMDSRKDTSYNWIDLQFSETYVLKELHGLFTTNQWEHLQSLFSFLLSEWFRGVGISIIGIAMWEETVGLDSSSDCYSQKEEWYPSSLTVKVCVCTYVWIT